MLLEPPRALAHCLTCGGTGKRGNLSGRKLCKTCKGTGTRTVLVDTSNATVCDMIGVQVPRTFYSHIKAESLVPKDTNADYNPKEP